MAPFSSDRMDEKLIWLALGLGGAVRASTFPTVKALQMLVRCQLAAESALTVRTLAFTEGCLLFEPRQVFLWIQHAAQRAQHRPIGQPRKQEA